MASFLTQSQLGRAGLKISLTNWSGYSQDAYSVKYTIYSADGRQVSGTKLPAIRHTTGQYYVPWTTDVPNGSYKIEWEIQEEFDYPSQTFYDYFFVVDPSNYLCGTPIGNNAIPRDGYFTFLSGQTLGANDLPLFLRNEYGLLQDAYAVYWTIFDSAGRCVLTKTVATRISTGVYASIWYVNLCSGDYIIKWEYQADLNTPMVSKSTGFSVVNPCNPYAILTLEENCYQSNVGSCYYSPSIIIPSVVSVAQCGPYSVPITVFSSCPSPCYSPSYYVPCTSVCPTPTLINVTRIVHLEYGVLPSGGSFTNQNKYTIASGINRIIFYIVYARGDVGGFPAFRLLWGNGTEEAQESVFDSTLSVTGPTASQDIYLSELDGPAPNDANPISFSLTFTVPGGATTVRLLAAEKGNIPIPGSLSIALTGSSTT